MEEIKQQLKQFIIKKVRENTTEEKPFFFLKWSGLYELCKHYNVDLIKLVDEMAEEGLIRKALIKGKLAIALPDKSIFSKKSKAILKEFKEFKEHLNK